MTAIVVSTTVIGETAIIVNVTKDRDREIATDVSWFSFSDNRPPFLYRSKFSNNLTPLTQQVEKLFIRNFTSSPSDLKISTSKRSEKNIYVKLPRGTSRKSKEKIL